MGGRWPNGRTSTILSGAQWIVCGRARASASYIVHAELDSADFSIYWLPFITDNIRMSMSACRWSALAVHTCQSNWPTNRFHFSFLLFRARKTQRQRRRCRRRRSFILFPFGWSGPTWLSSSRQRRSIAENKIIVTNQHRYGWRTCLQYIYLYLHILL